MSSRHCKGQMVKDSSSAAHMSSTSYLTRSASQPYSVICNNSPR